MTSIDPKKHYLEKAAHYLDLGSADGMNLAGDMLRLCSVSLPLVKILNARWEALMENKRDLLISNQVRTYRAVCIDYLYRRIEEMEQEVSAPVEPWTELAVSNKRPLREKLMWAGEGIRGVLETVHGVFAPETVDPEALRMAAVFAADLMQERQLKDIEILEEACEGLPMREISESFRLELPPALETLCSSLLAGDSKKAYEFLDKVKGIFAAAGRHVRWRIFEKQRKDPSEHYRCTSCSSPYVFPSKAGRSDQLICHVCAERFFS